MIGMIHRYVYIYLHIRICMCRIIHIIHVLFTALGLNEVGIFRLPGSTIRVNELKELFNEGLAHMLCMYIRMYVRIYVCMYRKTRNFGEWKL